MTAEKSNSINITATLSGFGKYCMQGYAFTACFMFLLSFAMRYDGDSWGKISFISGGVMVAMTLYFLTEYFLYKCIGINNIFIDKDKLIITTTKNKTIEFGRDSDISIIHHSQLHFEIISVKHKGEQQFFSTLGFTRNQVNLVKLELCKLRKRKIFSFLNY